MDERGTKINNQQESIVDSLVDETYAITLDPGRYDHLMRLWNSFVQTCIEPDPRNKNDTVSSRLLETHFSRAIAIFNRLGRNLRTIESAESMVNGLPIAALVVDQNRQVVTANKTAHRFLITSDQQSLEDLTINDEARVELCAWLGRCSRFNEAALFLPCYLGDKQTRSCLTATRIDLSRPALLGHFPYDVRDGSYFLITTVDFRLDQDIADAFAQAYSLTLAEAEVALELARGSKPKDIASQRAVSINTIRTQIKIILRKLDVAGLPALVALLSGFVASYEISQAACAGISLSATIGQVRRRGAFILSDGRQLAFEESGSMRGRPVLMIHNMLHGPSLTDTATEVAARKGWRLIAPSRAGFGKSDPNHEAAGLGHMDATAQDFVRLLDHLDVDKVLVLGHLTGGIHGLRFAQLFPDRVKGLILSNYIPSWDDARLKEFPGRFRVVAMTVRYAPSALPFIARAGAAHIEAGHEDLFLKALHGESDIDMQALRRPDVKRVVCDGLHHGCLQGTDSFCKDCYLVPRDFTENARAIRVPATMILGSEDQVFPIEHGRKLIRSTSNFSLEEIDGAGFYLLYTHWPQVFETLEKMDALSESNAVTSLPA